VGTPTGSCPAGEGGLRQDGGRDCSHAGVSRYSLDFAAFTQEEGALTSVQPVEVLAAADGTVIDVCLRPPTEITCGPNGPFVTVEHLGGFVAIYAHLDPASVTIRRKTPVTRGQRLGTMGAWGAGEDAWVHFELRFEGQGAQAASVLERLVVDDTGFRLAADGEKTHATLTLGPGAVGGFMRFEFKATRTPIGPSIGPRIAAAFAYADAVHGAGIGPVTPAQPARR